jgi:hypothetical protein
MSCSWLATSITAGQTSNAATISSNRGALSAQPAKVCAIGLPRNLPTWTAVSASLGGPVSLPASASSGIAARCPMTSATDQPGQAGTAMPSCASSSPAPSPASRSRDVPTAQATARALQAPAHRPRPPVLPRPAPPLQPTPAHGHLRPAAPGPPPPPCHRRLRCHKLRYLTIRSSHD